MSDLEASRSSLSSRTAAWTAWPRALEVRGLTPCLHAEGEPALRLDQVSAGVDSAHFVPPANLHLRELRIKGVDLHLVRGEDGAHPPARPGSAAGPKEQGDPADGLRALYRRQRILVEDARFSLDCSPVPAAAGGVSLTRKRGQRR